MKVCGLPQQSTDVANAVCKHVSNNSNIVSHVFSQTLHPAVFDPCRAFSVKRKVRNQMFAKISEALSSPYWYGPLHKARTILGGLNGLLTFQAARRWASSSFIGLEP